MWYTVVRRKRKKEDEEETAGLLVSAGLCIPLNNGGLENSSSTGQGPSQTWVATNTVSKQMALHDVIIIGSTATKQGWSKQQSCHLSVERQNYGWHNRMAFDLGQKKHRWTKPCLYEGWAGWQAHWMKAGSSGHIWTGKIKSWNPQADLSCSFWPCVWPLLLNQQLPVCANGKYNKFTLDSM